MNRANQSSGFTIIEMLMAMTFVSVLMLLIALTVIQVSNIYNKGLTMKAVDQAGRDISADLRKAISDSPPFDTDINPSTGVSTTFRLQGTAPSYDGGRLCTGTYSYIWNVGNASANRYAAPSTDKIRFVRVADKNGLYCTGTDADLATPIQKPSGTEFTELLSQEDGNLAVQSFNIKRLVNDVTTGQALYRIVIEIGTDNQDAIGQTGATLDTIDTTCKPPSDASSEQNFCAVNQFDFTALAGNKGGVQ